MSVLQDMVKTYRNPRAVFRRRVGEGPREDRALAVLMFACALVFAAQMPRLARQAHETGEELNMLLAATLLGWLFIMPLVLYALGTITHLIARVFGGRGSAYTARFALFWALLCAAPIWLLWGLVAGFIGPGVQLSLVGLLALVVFILFWSINLREAESGTPQEIRAD
ncbi:YIP1 family protein [Aliiroseovarius sp. F20344]|uniref:YIP1 family protein n=1 Tax=Aliiroseovarius sp. F20344 TaxID=2926414 RepID=UPI001FF13F20|nr:YIP1 family protein [Aliiroseovarius sp. F20344]MCK0143734.1 YIP1 family protein [Aliiroseovarius sp. F20344]